MSRTEQLYDWFDDRLDIETGRDFLGKAFPAEDSFLLGEIAAFTFLMLVLSGIFLGFFYEPSTSAVEYQGSVDRFQGDSVPGAFASVLQITYDVPFGMFIRRLHHWAAHLFIASIGLHMLRVFFTGAYRNPREPNWVVGGLLSILGMGAAYTGYALPFDEFASTATGIGYTVANSIPIIGGLVGKIVFGGQFPSSATIPRLYFLHVLIIPLTIGVLLVVHFGILVRQKHTEAPRDGDIETADGSVAEDDDSVIVGLPAFPNQAAVSAVVFFLTLAVLSLLAGFLPVHNVAQYGPNDPAGTPALIMPDWFFMWLYGFLKLLPTWLSFDILGVHFSTEFWGGIVLPTLVFVGVFVWPFLDRTDEPTHFTTSPFDRPWQTAIGVGAVAFILIASLAGMNNIAADVLGVSTGVINPWLTLALIVVPIGIGGIVYRMLSSERASAGDESPPDEGTNPDESESGPESEPPSAKNSDQEVSGE